MWGAILQDDQRASPDAILYLPGRFSLPARPAGSLCTTQAAPTSFQPGQLPRHGICHFQRPHHLRRQKPEYISLPLAAPSAPLSVNLLIEAIPVTNSPQSASRLQTWKLTLAYDGTDFRGWQVQPGEATIQGELQSALGRITGESPLPQGSGRTDAGVHALAQVASFVLRAPIPPENLLRALNRTLPPSIRVLDARTAPTAFHARHSAVAKTYEYRVFREAVCPPFLARYVHACPWPMDVEALQRSARLFEGEHDFTSFAATDPEQPSRGLEPEPRPLPRPGFQIEPPTPSTVKRVFSSSWEERQSESGDLLVYRVRGSGFLHHMVRNLVGTMLDVGRGRLQAEEIPGILAARARSAAGPTAPSRGLFLHSVEYDESGIIDKPE
jgi:tRNA pseudouridine38-40 synthase